MRVVVYKFIISLKIGLLYLHQASEGGITEVGRVLLEHGVDANVRNANATPLLTYIWQGARCSGVRNVVTLNSLLLQPEYNFLDLFTGKRGSDFVDKSESRKRPRQDAVAVDSDVRGGGCDYSQLQPLDHTIWPDYNPRSF
jgi:hypothetical protein